MTYRAIRLVERFAECFTNTRRQASVDHTAGSMVGQQVFGIALGYEKLNDHDELRDDPVMRMLSGRLSAPLAGKSTLSQLEHAPVGGATRIKECQGDLFADRTSTATLRANQLRLWFDSMASVLLVALRRIGLKHSQFARATCGTIRLKLLKIGDLVRTSVQRIKVAMASGNPYQSEFALAHAQLSAAAA